MKPVSPNEIRREFLGVCGLNPWVQHNSSARMQMMSQHVSQNLTISGATERRCQSGMEREYGKYTFKVVMPVDGRIIKIIERYPRRLGDSSIAMNPQTIVLYENVHTKEIGMLDIPTYCSNHPYFGFDYKKQPGLAELRVDACIPAGTVLLDSPAITPDKGYKYGIELNTLFATLPSTSEDGIMICSDVLPRMSFNTYETRTVEWGNRRFALNLYGDENNYKPFPDIGDPIRPDGLLMCLRSYDTELSPVEQNINSLREPDFIHDKCVYAAGEGGMVIDIRVQHDEYNKQPDAVYPMEAQAVKYDTARRMFYQTLLSEYQRLYRDRGKSLRIKKDLHRLIVEAMAVLDTGPDRLSKVYRQAPLDDWRVTFVVKYTVIPTVGFKGTDTHGTRLSALK